MSEDKNWDWLQRVFKNARLRQQVYELAEKGTHDQLRAMIDAAEAVAPNKDESESVCYRRP